MPHYIPPDFLDNTTARTLAEALARIILEWDQCELDAATGFFEPHVWTRLEEAFPHLTRLRLLLGRPPEVLPQGDGSLDLRRFFRRRLQGDLEALPYNAEYVALIDSLLAFLRRDSVSVRLYRREFLHAKAYLFPEVAIVGSSNLTPSGLTANSELNLVHKSSTVAAALRSDWFERFWELSEDYKADLVQALADSKFGATPYTPFDVFIKVLYEYFKDRLDEAAPEAHLGVDLASFQQEGLRDAIRLLERHRGVLVADAVGLGKTYIGMGLLEHYLLGKRRRGYIPRGLVICPAQLRDLMWQPKLDEYGIKAQVLSMEEISRADFDWRACNEVDCVLVDESHNFRNPATGRYQNLMRLLATGRQDKRVVLMTATPINNTVWDLYHQVSLITRQNDTYYRDYGLTNLVSFFRAVERGTAELFDLLEEVAVRRSRQDIRRRQEAGELITLPGGREVRFPHRSLAAVDYDLTRTYGGFYTEVAAAIEALTLVSYNVEPYRREKDRDTELIESRNQALIGIIKTTLLKRLESSLAAFETSVRRAALFQQRFFDLLVKENRLLDSPGYRRLLALQEEGDATDVEALVASLPEVSIADYDLAALRRALENDLTLFDGMLRRLNRLCGDDEHGRDGKLTAVKARLAELLSAGHKVLLFTYYQDTARYLLDALRSDADWQLAAGAPAFDMITGSTDPAARAQLVRRFAPLANAPDLPSAETPHADPPDGPPLQLLISTDVLSEGQNLQDAGVLLNYDLHWNPVRMIQRAGRIDRLGSPHADLLIVNVFPEQGLEALLHLVARLQQRIRDIDRTVGLDASVLGEVVSERSLDDLRRLKAGDRGVLDELEQEAELTSTDEMRLPLLTALQQWGVEKVRDIPLGIHSGKAAPVAGIFLAFRARDRHFWRFYPQEAGGREAVTDKRQIFRWLQATPATPRREPAGADIFPLLERATDELCRELAGQRAARRLRPTLSRINQQLLAALMQATLSESDADDIWHATRTRVVKAIEEVNLQPFRRDPELKRLLQAYATGGDRRALAEGLDGWLVANELYREVAPPPSTLERIRQEDLVLVAWEQLG